MIVHPPVEAVSLITGQLLLDTMRDDTQRPTSATFFACLPFQRSIDSKKKKTIVPRIYIDRTQFSCYDQR